MKATKETQEKERDFGSVLERFKFNKYFTEQEKIEKFNELIEQYNSLINYRYSLQVMISSKNVSFDIATLSNSEEVFFSSRHKHFLAIAQCFDIATLSNSEEVFVTRRKKLTNEQIIAFQNEISSLNIIISWIESVILGEQNLLSKYKK